MQLHHKSAMGKLSRNRGKNVELAIAREIPGASRNHFEAEDLRHSILSIEVKHRKGMPKILLGWLSQCRSAAEDGKIPVLVVHEAQQKYEDAAVIMDVKSLRRLLERGEESQ